MWWILVALTPSGAVMAQSELEARLLRVDEGNRRLAMVPFQQAGALVVQYEKLVETQPLLGQLLVSAREAGALAAQVFTDEDAALTSPQETFAGCEEEAARVKEGEDRSLLDLIPKLALSIEYYGLVESVALTREEARRHAADMEDPLLQAVTTPIENFTYQWFQSGDLVTWQNQSTAAYFAGDKRISWQVTPTTGSRAWAGPKERGEAWASFPYCRLASSPVDTTQGDGRGIGR
ncbi:MAG: hypothetical protein GWQ05_04070 [Verrucomicrobiaceae bacterium]|nr:hypothetical protein [Verrucomicrobiaceae bacterium]